MDTLLLDTRTWDLVLDINGNLAVASNPYSVTQDVASACRTFLGELWYNTTVGIPYFEQVLGHQPPLSILKSLLVDAAKTVPGCSNPVVFISSFSGREIAGQIQFTDSTGQTQVAGF